ncbi:MAG: Polyketide cyclase / dehydrase and lipid transport [Solirubrobacterales bacterium]|nr:Polyketide cyclase / dehydrase and lipid transport [Solirubrobacterales bacterium]
MAAWKQQALIEAPVSDVWAMLSDPSRASEWAEDVIAVTGGPASIEKGSTFDVTARGPLGLKATTPFRVEELEDMRELKMQCQVSGFYSHWLLTEAQGGTFTELELGVEPIEAKRGIQGRAMAAFHTKSFLRRTVEKSLDGLRRAVAPLREDAGAK